MLLRYVATSVKPVATLCSNYFATTRGMKTPGERLRDARIKAGFRSARAAALELEIPVSTYNSHERAGEPGARHFSVDEAKTYARRFGTDYIWLLTGDRVSGGRVLSPEAQRAIDVLADLEPEDRDFVVSQFETAAKHLRDKR